MSRMPMTEPTVNQPSGRVTVAEIVGGLLGGVLLAGLGALLGRMIGPMIEPTWGDLVGVLLGSLLGLVLGVPVGGYLVNRRLGRRASFAMALLGSVLGVATVLLLAEPLRLNQVTALMWSLLVLLPSLYASAAMHWHRQLVARRQH